MTGQQQSIALELDYHETCTLRRIAERQEQEQRTRRTKAMQGDGRARLLQMASRAAVAEHNAAEIARTLTHTIATASADAAITCTLDAAEMLRMLHVLHAEYHDATSVRAREAANALSLIIEDLLREHPA